jgi:hypothetical protein
MGTAPTIRITSLLIGLLLSVTAIAKLWMLLTDPFADIRVGLPKSILWISVALELALAWFNFRATLGSDPLPSRTMLLVNLAVFAAFGLFSTTRWLLGYRSCGCSGSLELPIWFFVIFDLGLVVWLVILGRRHGLLDNAGSYLVSVWRSWSPERRGQFAGAGLFLAVMVALQMPFVASLKAMILGEPKIQATVVVNDSLKVGEESSGEVELRNVSSVPARIVGVSRSCRCFDLRDDAIALVVPPHSSISRALVIQPRKPGPLHQRVELFLDHPEQFRVAIDLVGTVSGGEK